MTQPNNGEKNENFCTCFKQVTNGNRYLSLCQTEK